VGEKTCYSSLVFSYPQSITYGERIKAGTSFANGVHTVHIYCICINILTLLYKIMTKGLKSYPPSYLKSSLHLCLEISFSSSSRNLLQFLQFSFCTLQSRKEENYTKFPMFYEIHTYTSSLITLKIMPRNLNEIVRL
jgi:hypothetical protein